MDDLGTEALSWYDLLVMSQHLQREASSAFATELHGPRWDINAQMLAMVSDALAIANWQRAGRRHAPKPKPIPRPWLKPVAQSLGRDAIPIADFKGWWDSKAPIKPAPKPIKPAAPKPKPGPPRPH